MISQATKNRAHSTAEHEMETKPENEEAKNENELLLRQFYGIDDTPVSSSTSNNKQGTYMLQKPETGSIQLQGESVLQELHGIIFICTECFLEDSFSNTKKCAQDSKFILFLNRKVKENTSLIHRVISAWFHFNFKQKSYRCPRYIRDESVCSFWKYRTSYVWNGRSISPSRC